MIYNLMNKFLVVGDQICTTRVERIEFQEGIIFSAMRSQIFGIGRSLMDGMP